MSKDSKPKSLFDHLTMITKTKDPNYWKSLSESDRKTFNSYMVHRFLSMNVDNLDLISQFQPYTEQLEPDVLYIYFSRMIPKSNAFLKYIKGIKQEKYEEWMVRLVSKWYECSISEAYTNVDLMYKTKEGRQQIKEICEAYGTDPKEITKLFRTYKTIK